MGKPVYTCVLSTCMLCGECIALVHLMSIPFPSCDPLSVSGLMISPNCPASSNKQYNTYLLYYARHLPIWCVYLVLSVGVTGEEVSYSCHLHNHHPTGHFIKFACVHDVATSI